MPRDKDLKKIVRARMKKTGEAYTTARAHVTSRSRSKRLTKIQEAAPAIDAHTAPAPAPPAAQTPDYARASGMSESTIAAKTGRSWAQWVEVLDTHEAAAMAHGDIARIVNETYAVDGWWSQAVTVGYERIKGLRQRGQRRSGLWEVSKSKTVKVPVGALFDACANQRTRRRWLTGDDPVVTTARTDRSLRMRWPDGTLVTLWFSEKGDAKSGISVQHTKIPDRATADRLKAEWSQRLDDLASILAAP